MDCVEFVLQCTPIPYLGLSYSIFRTIWVAVEEVQASRGQFRVLAETTAALLQTLDRQHHVGRFSEVSTVDVVNELEKCVNYFFPEQSLHFSCGLDYQSVKGDRNLHPEAKLVLLYPIIVGEK